MSDAAAEIELRCEVAHPGFALDVDVRLPGRGVTGLFGASGSGKTTCLRFVAGLTRGRGRLVVAGEAWQDDARRVFVAPHRRAIGYVFQHAALFPHLSVRANIEYGLRRVPASVRRVPFDDAVALLALAPLLERRPAQLSGGERQRVAIARALAASPRLLLLDEPLASLDLARRAEVLPYLQRLQSELDLPMLYVSHAPEEVARLAGHLVLLDAGRVCASGPTGELLTRLDLPLAHGDTAQSVLDVRVVGHDDADQLTRVALAAGGAELLLPRLADLPGSRRVVRVMARDVSLTLSRHDDSSIVNIVAATVAEIADDAPGHAMVRLDAGGAALLARITRRSARHLGLRPGVALHAQIKGGAIG